MEANTEVIENDSRPCNRNDTENEVSSVSAHKKRFSILGRSCRVPDVPKRYVEPTVLDTSLPYIPVYTHLKIYDLKPIERPTTPPILKELRLKFPATEDGTLSRKLYPIEEIGDCIEIAVKLIPKWHKPSNTSSINRIRNGRI